MIPTFTSIPKSSKLVPKKATDEMVLFEPFLLSNPKTSVEKPDFDHEYYDMLEATLYHLIFKYRKGWISSERQVMYSSDECISTIHFTFDEGKEIIGVSVFQRSSNLLNVEEDVQFFNYFINKYANPKDVELSIFVSMPHIFRGKDRKVV